MPGTPDDLYGGTTDADLIILRDSAADPSNLGEIRRNGNSIKVKDGQGVFDLRSGSGIYQLTGDVIAGPGSASQPSIVQGMGGSISKLHYVIVGGKYSTLQSAIDAASPNDVILVGPKGSVTSPQDWGDISIPAGKRLSIVGLGGAAATSVNIGKVTFAPTTGANILENEVFLHKLFINADFSGSQGVNFAGTAPARLRIQDCYVYNKGSTGNGVVSNNSGSGSSLYLDNCTIQSSVNVGIAVSHVQGYTILKNGCSVYRYQYQLQCAAGNVEILQSQLEGVLANEVVRVSGGFVSCGYSTIKNTTTNASGVSLTQAGAAFGMGDATFAIATGTGYCVTGVAGTYYMYGRVTYSHSSLSAYNVKVKNTVTSAAVTQTFTSSA